MTRFLRAAEAALFSDRSQEIVAAIGFGILAALTAVAVASCILSLVVLREVAR